MDSERDVELHLQCEHKQRSPYYDSSQISGWIDDLPDEQLRDTANYIYQGLTSLSRSPAPLKKRFKRLEAFRPAVEYVTQALVEQTTAAPSAASSWNTAVIINELFAEFADGYKRALMEYHENAGGLSRDQFILAIHRACRCLYKVLLTCYRFYFAVPPTIWKDLHQLYALAEAHKVHEIKVASEIIIQCPECSIADVYKQASLLALAQPYRYTRPHIETLNNAIKQWFPHCALRNAAEDPRQPGLFLAVLHSDLAPYPLPLVKERVMGQWRLIDTHNILAGLKKYLSTRSSTENENANGNFYSDLFDSWSYLKKRIAPRQTMTARVTATLGLHDSHVVLGRAAIDPDLDDQGAIIAAKDINAAANSKSQLCTLVNYSDTGACLFWKNHTGAEVKVGEILSLFNLNDSPRPFVGVIRWIKNIKNNLSMVGVQFLANNAEAVITRAADEQHNRIQVLPALLLRTPGPIEPVFSLITAASHYQPGRTITIYRRGHEHKLQLIKVLSATNQFTQFNFQPLSEHHSDSRSQPLSNHHQHGAVA